MEAKVNSIARNVFGVMLVGGAAIAAIGLDVYVAGYVVKFAQIVTRLF